MVKEASASCEPTTKAPPLRCEVLGGTTLLASKEVLRALKAPAVVRKTAPPMPGLSNELYAQLVAKEPPSTVTFFCLLE